MAKKISTDRGINRYCSCISRGENEKKPCFFGGPEKKDGSLLMKIEHELFTQFLHFVFLISISKINIFERKKFLCVDANKRYHAHKKNVLLNTSYILYLRLQRSK